MDLSKSKIKLLVYFKECFHRGLQREWMVRKHDIRPQRCPDHQKGRQDDPLVII